ncbi:MAG TPA: dTDP-4-dehydrorhamnose 3,5-epimerase [Rhodocyclaceae bacterium]|nr:dTDP-4-dehydrorhamnose 3,5-epimerase [Rhodocyclaceae bacterium]
MQALKTDIDGVLVLEPKVFGDARGFFYESHNRAAFKVATGVDVDFVQDNHSKSAQGVLRGLHFQLAPRAQGKLVRVIQGAVFDVAVDIRKESPTYGQWHGEILSAENRKQLWIPAGLAHGFLVLSESAEFLYKTTDYYAPEYERCLRWDDPAVNVAWPLDGRQPQLSPKDAQGLGLDQL